MIIKREYKLSPIEFVKFQLNEIINSTVDYLSSTDITLLSYIFWYKDDATDALVRDRIFTNPASVTNSITRLSKQGYLLKEEKPKTGQKGKSGYRVFLNPKIEIITENFTQVTILTIDTESKDVYHKYFKK